MFYHRWFCHDIEALHFKVVALCAVFCLSTFGPCTMTGTHNPMGYDEYGSYGNDLSSGSQHVFVGDGRNRILPPKLNVENICRRSDLFCFPSTLSSFFSDYHSAEVNVSGFSGVKSDETVLVKDDLRSSNHGNFQLLNGSAVSCSLELKNSAQDTSDSDDENDTPSIRISSTRVNDFSSLNVQVSPFLDWGENYLHFPSLAFLTVENRHKSSVLIVFEPYSTNTQFYPCNHTEIKLGPGEIASICFVFLPKWLGLSSAHLILQTSLGGFLVQAQGYAVEPPHMIQSSVGSSPWVVSLFNPSDKVLQLKEVSAWMSFSFGNISYSATSVCSVIHHAGSSEISFNEWLDIKTGQGGQPIMAIRPQTTWTVSPNHNEPILELEFPYWSQTNIFGSFCVQLLNSSSRDNLDTIVYEANFGGKSGSYNLETRLSISLNVLMPCDANGTTIVSLLVENDGPDLLTVVKISSVGENSVSLQTKYVEGLILFPHTVTQVATVAYILNSPMNLNCKLVVETNKSNAPELEISCSDIASLCSQPHSYLGYETLNYDHTEKKSSSVHAQPLLEVKAREMTKADESVLGNWRSQGTANNMSVLVDHEVLFSMVHVGTHQSKWINVINPSDQPVVMQLLLNSGEIINECRESDDNFQPSPSYTMVLNNNHTSPSRYGFSIAQNALTEAYVHPHGKAVLGPIVFHPADRCAWKSSALVRNNLSGVEWLSLRGAGASVSLVLLDDSRPVHTVELQHNYGQAFMKVLFAKNTGDLPLEVNRISVSGTKCELDGFVVGSCKGFSLQPGESRKIIISYRVGICAETVHRELELVMAGGILVVPVKVSLPTLTLMICRRSVFWIRFKKFFLAVLVSTLVIFIACSCMFSVTIKSGSLSKVHPSDFCLKPETAKQVVTSSLASTTLELKPMAAEPPKPDNLTVKTGKEKTRRRKNKRGSAAGLTGHFEVSSSHSSNSTPSSPLSPASSSTPKRSPKLSANQHVRAKSPANHGSTSAVLPVKEKSHTPPKTTALFARAPGAERKIVRSEGSSGSDAILKYNIWDYHLQLCNPSSSKVVSFMPTIAEDNNFGSFFEMCPQDLFTKSQAESVSYKQND